MQARGPWLWAAMAATLLSLGLGHALKTGCPDSYWLCYSDIPTLWGDPGPLAGEGLDRGIDDGLVPYVEGFNEYPVLTGIWIHGAALLADDADGFLRVNAVFLSLVALATTYVLWRMADERRVLWWALAPSLVLYAFHNWDLLAVLLAVLGVWAHQRERPLAAGVLLALGASAKIWPALLLPMLGMALLRDEAGARSWGRDVRKWLGPRSWRFGLGAVGTLAAVNLPFLLLNPSLYLATYRFHAERGPTIESFWSVARVYGDRWDLAWLQAALQEDVLPLLTRGLLLVALVLLAAAVWRRHLSGLEASFGALLAFLLTNVVFSVQYVLWVVPFLVLLRVPWERALLLFVADAAAYLAIFRYFENWGTPEAEAWHDWLGFASTFRHLALLVLLSGVVAAGWRRRTAALAQAG